MADSIQNQVRWVRGVFRDTQHRNMHRRAREIEDHKYYSALYNGQWTPSAILTMQEQGRPIVTWNFIKKHIDTESGMLLQNPFEFNFASEIGQDDKDADLMNELRYRDKDLGRWGASKTRFVVDGLINTGIMEIFIDRNKDKLGAVNFRRRIPTDFHFDPDWRSDDVRDNRQIFTAGYFDIAKILEDWGNTMDKHIEIEQAFETYESNRSQIQSQSGLITSKTDNKASIKDMPETLNNKFLVLEMQQLEDIRINKLFNRSNGNFLKENLDIFPMEDKRAGFQMLQEREKAELVEIPTNEKKLVVKTIAPGLSQQLFLANDPHELQIGDYPFTVWSAYNMNGERYGRVSQLKDPQAVANKSRAIWLHSQAVAGRANKLIGPAAFTDDAAQTKYEQERSRGGGNFDVNDPNAIVNDDDGPPPQDLEQSFNDAISFADKIGAPLAAQGQSKAGTSGILFNAEREQAAVSLEGLNDGLEKAENDMGEQYIDTALSYYGDDVARTFKSAKDQKDVFINTEKKNRISDMSRLSVRINQAPVGTSVKRENLQLIINLKAQAADPLERASLTLLSIPLIPGLTEENKEQMIKDAEATLETARLQNQAAQAEAQAMIDQAGGQPQVESQEQPQLDAGLESIIGAISGEGELPLGSETQGII